MNKSILTLIISLLCFLVKAQNEFITTWKPYIFQNPAAPNAPFPSTSTQAWAPFRGNNYTIYWEEVGFPSHNFTMTNVTSTNQVLLDFGTPLNPATQNATYLVKVSNGNGNFHRISFRDDFQNPNQNISLGDASKIIEINQWGSTIWSSMRGAFHGCRNINMTATDTPNLSNVSDMSYMFGSCEALVGNSSFNNWNTSAVTTLEETFSGCLLFNQPIGNWNTSNVQNMKSTFSLAQNFNQPIGNWNTSQVTTMESMFNTAKNFNQPIGNWNTSNVLHFRYMFSNAWYFNQPIAGWNTSQAISMEAMFLFAKAFNQPIGSWNTSNVTTMQQMFFGATVFNQPIGSWNTSNVTVSHGMFFTATAFNQNIGSWNTSQITNMQNMFNGASNFNQNLGNWNLSSLTLGQGMFFNSGLNCQNYDNTLYGWSQNPSTPNNISITSASPLVYTHPAAVAARNSLINNKGWTIAGDTYDAQCESILSVKEQEKLNEFNIYPNPATDFITLKNVKLSENFMIFDASGRIVLQGKLNNSEIDVRSLEKGNYLLQIVSKNKTENFKFIKK
ncbi:BspA family leucine-rich repeat surface protein [Chryseobacterium echinoideorum]|uniref:BspA family leucine-rich repeat surface protein n=1 Tax=Chryseobacterium echinoideorum TaxID=1549648 RepID=UPI001186A53B|nr:BspA family leucine-rich repeat surface protein [Chryseobacterium echinoideorum]